MIPKILHYCWFGNDEKPPAVRKCIDSWKKHCPDYRIIEWNTSNFDVNQSRFTQEAFSRGKWAFVADYFRLWVLYNFGGIYLDADVEIIRSFDDLLDTKAFIGFETDALFATCVMGSIKGNQWIDSLLAYYNDRPFIREDSMLDITPNPYIITPMTKTSYPEITLNDTTQHLASGLTLYSTEYFTPKDQISGELRITKNTHSIHHFAGSWRNDKINLAREYSHGVIANHKSLRLLFRTRMGKKLMEKPILLWSNYKINGPKYTLMRTKELLKGQK